MQSLARTIAWARVSQCMGQRPKMAKQVEEKDLFRPLWRSYPSEALELQGR
ncbi:MAG: hypothetical protein ACI8PT_000664 [Gammaproteobacteria bacterium]|jgi:hypothetical protein